LNFESGPATQLIKASQKRKYLVKDNFLALNSVMMIRNFDGRLALNILADYLQGELGDQASFFTKFLSDKYKININSLYTLFEQPMLIVIKPTQGSLNLENMLIKRAYKYALVWHSGESEKEKGELQTEVKEALQSYIAFKFPIKKKKILPDKSSGFELVADPYRFNWQQIIIQGQKINFLSFKNVEMAYAQTDGRFILANSKDLLAEVLRAKQQDIPISNFYNFYIKPANLIKENLVAGQVIYLGGTFEGQSLQGRLELLP